MKAHLILWSKEFLTYAMASDTEAAIRFSLEKLGYSELKVEQERVVKAFLSGKDVFGALPTVYGKSFHGM